MDSKVENLPQPVVEEQPKQVPTPRPVEEEELLQPMNKDSGEEFLQELFEEKHVYSVIIQCQRSRTKVMMKQKVKCM